MKLEAELNLSEVVSHLCFITNAHKISSTAIQLTINDQPIMWTKDEGRIFHILMDHFNTIELEG